MRKNENAENWQVRHPDRIISYFGREIFPLVLVTLSGIAYNVGLTAGPWFEGQLVQRLFDVSNGKKTFMDMVFLAGCYLLVISAVQAARSVKRFYVRRFSNDISRDMRRLLYNNVLHMNRAELEQQRAGALMTKAIADVDACVEGMRKFTTELFDTGIALAAYLAMLFYYDWRLALLSSAFTPVAYLVAQRLKRAVYHYNSAYKKSAGLLSESTMDMAGRAITYRVCGCEEQRAAAYEEVLTDYENKAVAANIWENTPQPIYHIIAMTGAVFILCFGARNMAGTGWTSWDLAAFTTFLVCFSKMAVKASKAAKLFNSVQKAQVSWQRIKPLLKEYIRPNRGLSAGLDGPLPLTVSKLSFAYPDGQEIFSDLSFSAQPGEFIGVTGPVACGKSTLGKVFLCESPYGGSIRIGDRELNTLTPYERSRAVTYMGHQPELISDTLEENVRLGGGNAVAPWLQRVCMEREVENMPEGAQTWVGAGGVQLSGGQQARTALARTLYHGGRLLILDDPFSAVDRITEENITRSLRRQMKDSIVILFSHRVTQFPLFDKVIWMEGGRCVVGTHKTLLRSCSGYARVYEAQAEEGDRNE